MGNENDEFFDMFYQPCLAAPSGVNEVENKRGDPNFIMVKPWHNLKECMYPTCLESNVAWDRKNGNGCVPGLLKRKSSDQPIAYESDAHCV